MPFANLHLAGQTCQLCILFGSTDGSRCTVGRPLPSTGTHQDPSRPLYLAYTPQQSSFTRHKKCLA